MESIPYRIAAKVENGYSFSITVPNSLSNCKYIRIDLVLASVFTTSTTELSGDMWLACLDINYAESLNVPSDGKEHKWYWCWMLTNKNNIDATRHPIYLPYQRNYTFSIRSWAGIPTIYKGQYVLELTGII